MSKTRIVFLDVDGVLNHELFYRDRHDGTNDAMKREYPLTDIDFVSVGYLNQICLQTGAKVVISSTWRLGRTVEALQELFKEAGFVGEIIDKTPNFEFKEGGDCIVRGNEIYKWIQDNEKLVESYFEYNDYVILDDDCDMLYYQRNNFIHIDKFVGITPQTVIKAIHIFESATNKKIYE